MRPIQSYSMMDNFLQDKCMEEALYILRMEIFNMKEILLMDYMKDMESYIMRSQRLR